MIRHFLRQTIAIREASSTVALIVQFASADLTDLARSSALSEHSRERRNRCSPQRRLLTAAGSSPCYAVLRPGTFPMLLKQFRNGTQRFIDLLSGSKFARNIRFQDDDITTFGIFCSVLAPHTFAEIIFPTHCIRVLR